MKNSLFNYLLGASVLMSAATLSAQQPAKPATTTTTTTTTTPAPAQQAPAPTVITWSGYVKSEYFYDSRQTVNAREGELLFMPSAISKDANGVDVNATPVVNMLAIQSRLRMGITGPEFYGMKTSGAIEAEFLGVTNGDINGLRLRHAFVQLTGAKSQITMGQTWHPFFSTDCFPGTYGFNTGLPFSSLNRSPQFKLSSVGKTKAFLTLYTDRDFKEAGTGTDPANTTSGANSISGVSLSGLPAIALGVSHSDGAISAGATLDFKKVRPALRNGGNLASTQTFNSTSLHAYLKYKKGNNIIKLQTIYGANLSDMLMLGAYAIKDSTGKDPVFTTLHSSSSWAEYEGSNAKMEWGLFVGYIKNLGFADALKTTAGIAGFQQDIKDAVRIAPRIGWKMNKMKIGVEVEYTAATRGAYKVGEKAITENAADSKTNVTRVMVIGQYNF